MALNLPTLAGLTVLWLGTSARAEALTRAAASPDFAREVRPILVQNCFECHGPEKQKNGYRLDLRDVALRGGESHQPAIVPHQAAQSPLIRYVSGTDPERVMPPEKSGHGRLTAEQVAILRAWIDAGPSWPEEFAGAKSAESRSWAWQPLVNLAVPSLDGVGHPIDAFIRAKLAAKKGSPSPEADRRTLIRRLSYDLTGLPPTPEAVEAFLQDPDPEAYGQLVERLLDSPHYGERWARHWLDTIHYADSHGFEHDLGRDHAWPFRDYVIASFNRDTSWPRFIREQLAADYFYPDQPQLTPALGFLGAGTFDLSTFITTTVTFDYLDRDDLVTQTLSAFASTTANCARCHAHKFDPISQEDYYALQAVFAGVLKGDVVYDAEVEVARERKRWNRLLAAAEKEDATLVLAPEQIPLVEAWTVDRGNPVPWRSLALETFVAAEGSVLTREAGEILAAGGLRPDKDVYTLTATSPMAEVTALRLDVLADDRLPKHGPGRQDNGNLHLSELVARVFEPGGASPRALKFRRATADFNQSGWGVERAIDGDLKTAWGIFPAVGQSHHAVFELDESLHLGAGAKLVVELKQGHGQGHLIGRFRLAVTDGPPKRAAALTAEVEAALRVPAAERTLVQRMAVAVAAVRYGAESALAKLPAPRRVFAAASTVELVNGDATKTVRTIPAPKPVHVLHRGEFQLPRALAEPGAISSVRELPGRFVLKDVQNEAERRAALADWLAHPENPLTWRSIVNRVWHYHFGRGLSDTPSDLGQMGGEPSHPQLLDWLAVWFRDNAHGSLKELHRLIVTSATYRQTSEVRPELAYLDAENRLLWRQNCHRLDADSYRDFVFAVSGNADLSMGGPGVRHFKAGPGPQLTPALDYSAYDWSGPGAGRRSIYRHVWRGIADPFMEALDFPDLGLLAPVRSFSASSLQALALYNNDFVLHQSAVLAKRLEQKTDSLEGQVKYLIRLLWVRAPTPEEARELTQFAREQSLPALVRLLLNSNEFLFVP